MENNVDIRDAFFDKIYELAAKDENVVFLTADADAFSLRRYKNDFPTASSTSGWPSKIWSPWPRDWP